MVLISDETVISDHTKPKKSVKKDTDKRSTKKSHANVKQEKHFAKELQ